MCANYHFPADALSCLRSRSSLSHLLKGFPVKVQTLSAPVEGGTQGGRRLHVQSPQRDLHPLFASCMCHCMGNKVQRETYQDELVHSPSLADLPRLRREHRNKYKWVHADWPRMKARAQEVGIGEMFHTLSSTPFWTLISTPAWLHHVACIVLTWSWQHSDNACTAMSQT